MALHARVAASVLQAGGVLAILGLAVTAFLLLPADLLFNDYVAGTILGVTILMLAGFARIAHPDADRGRTTGPDS